MHIIDLNIEKIKNLLKQKKINQSIHLINQMNSRYQFNSAWNDYIKSLTKKLPPQKIQSRFEEEFRKKNYNGVINASKKLFHEYPFADWIMFFQGISQKEQGNLHEAENIFNTILLINPFNSLASHHLAKINLEQGYPSKAIETLEKLRASNYKSEDLLYDLALAYLRDQNPEDALFAINQSLQNIPADINDLILKSSILKELKKFDEALEILQNLKINSNVDKIQIKVRLAELYRLIGNKELSKSIYKECMQVDHDYTNVHFRLSTINNPKENEALQKLIEKKLSDHTLNNNKKADLYFSLFNIYHQNRKYNEAFEVLEKANKLRKKSMEYDIVREIDKISLIKNFFTDNKKIIRNFSIKLDKPKPKPIFIVGMPRSGTTLLEVLLSRHKDITGLGELSYLEKAVYGKTNNNDIHQLFNEVREYYYDQVSKHQLKTEYFIDKMPQNFKFLGIIVKAIPEAKILHLTRNPTAVCWSQYKTNFGSLAQGYSNDIDDIITFYNLYRELMKFWHEEFSENYIECNYERIVEEEGYLKRIVEQIEVKWDPKILDHSIQPFAIKTASSDQVAKPIYKGSSSEWKNYSKFISKLTAIK